MSAEIEEKSLEAFEQGVIASILTDVNSLAAVSEVLEVSDFIQLRHQLLFDKAVSFYRQGKVLDLPLLLNDIASDGNLDKVGGWDYVINIIDPTNIYSKGDPVVYASKVFEASSQRRIDLIAQTMHAETNSVTGLSSGEIIAGSLRQLQDVYNRAAMKDSSTLTDVGNKFFESLNDMIINGVSKEDFIPTGFTELDERLGGLSPGQMVIVAGRPGHGKTTLALDICRNAAKVAGQQVLFFSLEMGEEELYKKLLSAEARVKYEKVRKGINITEEEYEKLLEAKQSLDEMNILIDENPELSIEGLKSKCLKQKSRPEGLDLVVVDYLQLMKMSSGIASRQEQVAEISRSVKLLSKELACPIIIVAQLNRGNTNRTDKRPMVSDLRESGSLEQDADAVLLVHRPSDYDEADKPGVTEVIVGKNRNGSTGICDLMSLLEYSKFANPTGQFQRGPDPELAEPDQPQDYESEDVQNQMKSHEEVSDYMVGEPESGVPAF